MSYVLIGFATGIAVAGALDYLTGWSKGFMVTILSPLFFFNNILGSFGMSARYEMNNWLELRSTLARIMVNILFGGSVGAAGGMLIRAMLG